MLQTNRNYTALKKQVGFTLLEVIIALIIFSISLLAITRALGQSARGLSHVEQKTYAHWVARNATNQLLLGLKGGYLHLGEEEGAMLMGPQEYRWHSLVEVSPDPLVWIIHVRVSDVGRGVSLTDLTTYARAAR